MISINPQWYESSFTNFSWRYPAAFPILVYQPWGWPLTPTVNRPTIWDELQVKIFACFQLAVSELVVEPKNIGLAGMSSADIRTQNYWTLMFSPSKTEISVLLGLNGICTAEANPRSRMWFTAHPIPAHTRPYFIFVDFFPIHTTAPWWGRYGCSKKS